MKVLVICEDPTNDEHIVKPVIANLFEDLGRAAQVEVLWNPRLRGFEHLMSQLDGVLQDNPMVGVFLVIADRDGSGSNHDKQRLQAVECQHRNLVTCCAVEEVETWMLALHRDRLPAWQQIRAERSVKEVYAQPFLEQGRFKGPGHGRKAAMREAIGAGWKGLLQLCPEVLDLKDRIERVIGAG